MLNTKTNKKGCPNCGSNNLDGDNLAAWCNDCGWDNFGTY